MSATYRYYILKKIPEKKSGYWGYRYEFIGWSRTLEAARERGGYVVYASSRPMALRRAREEVFLP